MKKAGIGLAVLVMVFSGIFSGGCEDEQATGAGSSPQDTKMTRLISAENRQFKKDLEAERKQMAEQKQELDKCLKEKQEWQYKAEKGLQEEAEKMSSIAMTEHQQQSAEIEKLNAEIARLKGQKPQPEGEQKSEDNQSLSTPPPAPPAPPAE
jgi:LDH2 family malate/lactate/ureidoglycolate dehydrogenase